jgi:hypothetical protein
VGSAHSRIKNISPYTFLEPAAQAGRRAPVYDVKR